MPEFLTDPDWLAFILTAILAFVGLVRWLWTRRKRESRQRTAPEVLRNFLRKSPVGRTMFYSGLAFMVLGLILRLDFPGIIGLFLVLASGAYAVFFILLRVMHAVVLRESRQQQQQQQIPTNPTTPDRAPIDSIEQTHATPTDVPETVSASSNPVIGETVGLESGARITVHSYESPVPPPLYTQPDSGYEFAAIDVEGYAGPNSENYLDEGRS